MYPGKMKRRTLSGTTDSAVSSRELEHKRRAGKAAAEGIVLLKNEGSLLPIPEGTKVAMYGRGVRKTVKGGTGSGAVNERASVSLYEGMKNAGFEITTEAWLDEYDRQFEAANAAWVAEVEEKAKTMWSFTAYTTTPFDAPDGGRVTKTDADIAIFVISRIAGEGADRRAEPGDYYLSAGEKKLMRSICALYKKVIVVINAGGQVDLSFMDEHKNICALLILGMPGMDGGTAFADILLGKETPSGRLTDTWAYDYEDFPSADTFSYHDGNTYVELYKEGLYVGYRYFDTFDVPVRYGFGSGISYTDFDLETLSAEVDSSGLTVKVRVTNTGKTYAGKEVVQIYATCPQGKLDKEYRRLVGFGKTKLLAPGEAETLTITVPVGLLASYDEDEPGWILEGGRYYIWVGASLESSAIEASLEVDGTAVLERTHNECFRVQQLQELQADKERDAAKRSACALAAEGKPMLQLQAGGIAARNVQYRQNRNHFDGEAMELARSLTEDQLLRLVVGEVRPDGGSTAIAGEPVIPGACGETSRAVMDKNLPSLLMADGPAGLRLTRKFLAKDGILNPASIKRGYYAGSRVPDDDGLTAGEGEELRYQYCTAIPTGTQVAQSWNTELAESLGRLVAEEMEEFDITFWLAPGMNIHRNPLCGRNFEYYSEDPLVSGRMAASITQGVQSVPGCMTMIKHFACNNQEEDRYFSNSVVSERVLREIYLKGFEIAIREGQPKSVMTSYNLLNGVHTANSYGLCTNILRNEWGFDGIVATDWRLVGVDGNSTAAGCVRAGNDLCMPGFESDIANLKKELQDGTLLREDLLACASRVISVIWQSNQYEGKI